MSLSGDERLKGMLLVVLAGCCWGMSGTLQAYAPPEATSSTVGAVRVFGSGVILLLATLAVNARSFFSGKWRLFPVILAGASLTGYQLLFFASVLLTGAGVAAIISIGSSPAMAGILGVLIFRERLTPRWYIATAVAICGGVLLTTGGTAAAGRLNLFGVLLALAAGLCYALEGVGLKMLQNRTSFEGVTAVFIASALFAVPILFRPEAAWVLTPRGLIVSFALACVTSAMPFVLFSMGLRVVGVAKSYTLSLSEPITAWLLSTVLLGQKLAPTALIGVAAIFASIIILAGDVRGGESKKRSGSVPTP